MASKYKSPERPKARSSARPTERSPERKRPNGSPDKTTGAPKPDKKPPEDFIKCELCRQTLENPKSLACMHSYCRDCLTTYITETTGNTSLSQTNVVCPICLQVTNAPREDKPPEDWADHLETNDFLVGYLEANSLKSPGKLCDTCTRQNKSTPADRWCSHCHDALCDDCVEFHNALRTTTQHKLVYLSKLRHQPIENIISTPHCKTHDGEPVTKYCENHRDVLCEKCVAANHKSCRDVKLLRESAMKQKNDASKTNATLGEETSLAKQIYDDRVKTDRALDGRQTGLLQKIQSVRLKINENLMKCETQLIGELYDVQGKERAVISHEMKEAQRIRKAASKIQSLGENTVKYGMDSHSLQTMPEVSVQSDHYKGKLTSLNSRIKNTQIDFLIDPTLEQLMNGIGRLGHLRMQQTKAALPTSHNLKALRSDSDPEDEYDIKGSRRSLKSDILDIKGSHRSLKSDRRSVKSVRIEPVSRVSVSIIQAFSGRTSSDTEQCWFTGITFMPNDTIILVDRNNNKLKMINKNYQLVSETHLQHQPFGITMVSTTEIAVTIPRENKIELFTVGSSVTPKETIVTSDRCYGITYAGDRFAVTCTCASPPTIKILSRTGEEKHELCPEDNYHPMFFRPWYIKMDSQGTNMYVSDTNRCHVTCITGTVMKMYMYKDQSINSPRGLCLTNDKRLLVCGFGSDNIQLIDADGNFVCDVLVRNDDVIGPQEVALNPANDTMVVTFDPSNGNSEIVKVYRISL